MPAVEAPRAKASSFVVTVLIPFAAAASSSSRIASQARPSRLPGEPVAEDHDHGDQDHHRDVVRPRVDGRERSDPGEVRAVDAADPVRAVRQVVRVEEDDRDDLAESERHDRQVVTPQAQRRSAQEDAEGGGHEGADDEHRPEDEPGGVAEERRDVDAQDLVAERRGGVRVGVGADREERRVAEVQEAGHADDQVEAEGQEHEHAGVREAVDPGVLGLERREGRHGGQHRQDGRHDGHPDDDAHGAVAGAHLGEPHPEGAPPPAARGGEILDGAHARSPTCWPRRPAGRKTRTMTRTPKTTAGPQRP